MLCTRKLFQKTHSVILKQINITPYLTTRAHAHFSFFSKKQSLSMSDLVKRMNVGLQSIQGDQIDQGIADFQHIVKEFAAIKDKSTFTNKELPLLLRAHYELARIFERRNQLREALDNYTEALNISKEIYQPQSLEVADVSNAVGRIYTKLVKSDEANARAYLATAKTIFSNLADDDKLSPHLLENEYIKNMLYGTQGHPEKALELLEWISEQPESRDNATRPGLETVFQSIGDMHMSMNNITQAIHNWQRAIGIASKEYGASSEKVLEIYNGVAQSSLRQGNFKEAKEYIKKSLKIYSEGSGISQARYAESLLIQGFINFREGEISKALASYEEGLTIIEAGENKSPEEVWTAYLTVAEIYLAEGRLEKAIDCFNKAEGMINQNLGDYHPELAGYSIYFADLLKYKAQREPEAKALYKKALDIYLNSGSIHDPRIIDTYHELGPPVFKEEKNLNYFFGVLQFQQQKFDESAKNLIKAITAGKEAGENVDKVCENISLAFRRRGLISKANEINQLKSK